MSSRLAQYIETGRPRWQVPNWSRSFRLQCRECWRALPEEQFKLLEVTRKRRVYGPRCRTCRRGGFEKAKVDRANPLYSDTSVNDLLAYSVDFDGNQTAGDGTDFVVSWNASGIFTVS